MKVPPQQRFWPKVEKTDGCWEWTASKNKFGYGQIAAGTTAAGKKKVLGAHRVAYEMTYGPIPEGLDIDHACRNRGCVKPTHLRAVTTKQNCENLAGAQSNNVSSGVRGVYRTREGKWLARVTHNGKQYRAGIYETIPEAEAAVLAKRLELFTHNELDRQQQQGESWSSGTLKP